MDLKFTKTDTAAIKTIKDSSIALGIYEDEKLSGQAGEMDKLLGGLISQALKDGSVKAEAGSLTYFIAPAGMKSDLYILGLGKKKELKVHTMRKHIASAVKTLIGRGVVETTLLFDGPGDQSDAMRYLRAVCDTFLLKTYKFEGYFSKKDKKHPFKKLTVNISDTGLLKAAAPMAARWVAEAEGVIIARDLANAPANLMYPETMAGEARKMCRANKLICQVLGKPEIEKLGMGLLLGVNAGSAKPPRLIIMDYKPTGAKKTICVVGKGLTFDSGGISIKPWEGMWDMKGDMGGAAAVFGIMHAVAKIKPKVRVIGLCPCTENMPDGNALKPGDVITSMNGKTVEIHSTDAEGRLVLADALEYAEKKYKPDVMLDLATLTGACVVALGDNIIGLFADDDPLADDLIKAGDSGNEPIWKMPVYEDYKELLKSDVADQKNVGGRWGGAITAALFLRRFVDMKKYAHLDIAGPAIIGAERWDSPAGCTGAGVRLVVEYILGL